jgi:predicted PurR-regulated permease PerM
MLHTILTLIGFVLVSILVILLIRVILFLQKIFANINTNINEITNEIKGVRKDISDALSGIDKLLSNATNTIDRTNEAVSQMKNVINIFSAPITGVQRYTSAIGKFIEAFRDRLKSNKKRLK